MLLPWQESANHARNTGTAAVLPMATAMLPVAYINQVAPITREVFTQAMAAVSINTTGATRAAVLSHRLAAQAALAGIGIYRAEAA